MSQKVVGVDVGASTAGEVLKSLQRAEQLGIPAAWMTTGGVRLDNLTMLAVGGERTQKIKLGTSIVPTYPRHPMVMVQQVLIIAQLAPGRFRLGIGPSHRPSMEALGINFRSPLGNLREYLQILKPLLQKGKVDFEGTHYVAHESLPEPVDVPVMASALRQGSFELCGAEADGAISWICPGIYLRNVALPAMQRGAEGAGRPVPPLIAHLPVSVHTDAAEVRTAVRAQIMNPRLPFYQRMMDDAGFPEASNGTWSNAMIDAAVAWGDETRVAERIQELLSFGATEVLATPIAAGADRTASIDRTMRLLGQVAQSVAG